MKSWKEKIEAWFAAVAFAEAGERETALGLVGLEPRAQERKAGVIQTLSDTFAAAAFAEADCHEAALEIAAAGKKKQRFVDIVGLRGVRVRFGFVSASNNAFLDAVGLTGASVRYMTVRI
jgi:hypothetical protein